MNWGQVVTIGTPIAVAVLGIAGTVWGKALSRRTEDATARKLNAETVSIEVSTARGLVEDVKKLMSDQRVEYESRLAATRSELAALTERFKVVEMRQQMLLAALAAHAPWDQAAHNALRSITPDFPPPPPLRAHPPSMEGEISE